jgi:hypothetical protein
VFLAAAFYLVDRAAEDRGRFDAQRKMQIAEYLDSARRQLELSSDKEDDANAARAVKNNFDEQLATNRKLLSEASRRGVGTRDARNVLAKFHALGFQSANLRTVHNSPAAD